MPIKFMDDSLRSIACRPPEEKAFFGVTYLDAALKGISCNDLIVVSGLTGIGKTELGVKITKTNLKAGKKPLYVALEAEEDEITDRMRFQEVVRLYKEKGGKEYLLYDEYRDGLYNIILRDELKKADEVLSNKYGNLVAFYRGKQDRRFGSVEMVKLIEDNYEDIDLFVFDHLHYFDLNDRDENKEMKILLHEMRDMVLIYGKPIVLIAHIRKRSEARIVPIIDDVMGSSDIGKTATKLVFLAPYYGTEIPAGDGQFPTIFHCSKYRRLSMVSRDAGIQLFDVSKNDYLDDVWLGKIDPMCTKFTPIKKDLFRDKTPVWARKRIRNDLIRYDFGDDAGTGRKKRASSKGF